MRNFLIVIHGSCLAAPGSAPPNDIDVIVGHGSLENHRAEIEACVRAWAAEHNLAESLPLDIKECAGIPMLPFCPPPMFRILRGDLPTPKALLVQYDLAAWIRACERSEDARRMFLEVYANREADNPGKRPIHIGFTTATEMNLQNGFGAYQGGGRFAIEAAATKCPLGWAFVSKALDIETREMVRRTTYATSTVVQMMEGFISMGAPVGTGQCSLVSGGVWTEYGHGMRTWAELAELLRGVQAHRNRLSPEEREILADCLAKERTERRAGAGPRMRALTTLAQDGKLGWPDAMRLKSELACADPEALGGLPLPALLKSGRGPLTLLNTSIVTGEGVHSLRKISLDEARALVTAAPALNSAVGHQATAEIMTTLLGVDVPVNRQAYASKAGDTALVFKLNGRPPEGKILTLDEMNSIGFEFFVMCHLAE